MQFLQIPLAWTQITLGHKGCQVLAIRQSWPVCSKRLVTDQKKLKISLNFFDGIRLRFTVFFFQGKTVEEMISFFVIIEIKFGFPY